MEDAMKDRIRRCQCRAALTARAAHAHFTDTVVVGTMMAAAIAATAWLMIRLAV
jgi:hypothetical protein